MCSHCPMTFQTREDCHRHCVNAHPELCEELPAMEVEDPLDIKLVRQALEDTYRKYDVNLDNIEVEDVNALFLAIRKKYKNVVKLLLKKYRNFKMQFRINCQFYREDGGVITYAFVPMESFNFVVENDQYGNFAFRTALSNFNVRIEDFQENGSGWIFQRLNEFSILFSEYQAFIGRGGTSPLPPLLCRKRNSLLNVPGDDEFCFLRCLIAALYKHELPRANRKSFLLRRKFYDDRMDRIHQDLDLSGIHFPFNTKQAKKFEFQNPRYGLNIFMYDEAPEEIEPQFEVKYTSDNTVTECELPDAILNYNYERAPENWKEKMKIYKELRRNIYPLSLCKEERDIIIDILLIQDGDDGHYILIENLLSLVKIPHSTQKFICRYCLQTFDKQAKTHEEFCASLGRMRTDFPERKFLMWENYKNTIPLLFLGAMDFESRLKPVDITKGHTQKIKKHIAAGYAWAISDNDGNLVSHKKYVAQNDEECVAEKMLLELLVEADKVAEQVKDWNKEAYDLAKKSNSLAHRIKHDEKCGFCDELIFSEGNSQYVRHHQHYPPFKFEFYAHPFCNTTAQTSRKLVVLAHNLRGYDSHFLIKACAKKSIEHRVEVIGTSSEKFFAVFVGKNLVFIDSLNFFSASLETVAGTMDKKTDFKLSRKYFMSQYHDEAKVELMLRKGVYPYDFFSDLSKYDETQLPPAKDFYDSLGNKEVNPLDYEHAQTVWRELGVRNLREYTELYNISDVLLLLDCFNKLRDVFMKNFGLDPGHFFSLPHLTWECALKETKAKLDYIKDPEMMTFLESAIRGGVASGLEYRTAKANNPHLPDYDPTKPNSYIMVHDVNNLYGKALCSYLPVNTFKWLTDEQLEEIRKDPKTVVSNMADEGEKGWFLQVDLVFDKEIHDNLKGLTPVPYKRKVEFEEYSPGQQDLARKLGITDNTMDAKRLITDLHPKKKYVVHYRVLKMYLSLGIRITKVHKGIIFNQKAVLRPYLITLAELRRKAVPKFEQNMWKLAANACYGKSVEQVRNRCRFVIVRDRKQALRYNRKPTVSQVILLDSEKEGEDIAIIRLKKLHVILDKPIYLGITVLDESKKIMYDWYYNYAKPKWGDGLHTLATDTDSLISLIETENVYQDMLDDKKFFDMSDYNPKDETWKKYYCKSNKKVLGVMKDENANKCVSSFIFLRPKMYFYDVVNSTGETNITGSNNFVVGEIKKAKGLNRTCVKQQIRKADYLEALENPIQKRLKCTSIRSEKHELFTMVLSKKGLSSFEQKRYVLPDNISTLPYGHYLVSHEDNVPKEEEVF